MKEKMKYLDLIQGVISRMANNSFLLKGWTVTLVSAIFVLANKEANLMFYLVCYVPILVFWGLDSYYLQQERLYRALYSRAIKLSNEEVDFRLGISDEERKAANVNYVDCLFSVTEMWFYVPLALVILLTIMLSVFVMG